MDDAGARALLQESFRAAVAAADPLHDGGRMLRAHLPEPPSRGRTLVVGAGKAAASMAAAVEAAWPADAPLSGLVVTRHGHDLPLSRIELVQAGHPVPDGAGEAAAARILSLAHALTPEDRLLALVSGGGSSLLSLPVDAVPMAELKAVTRALLASGAPIEDMNVVRKHLSRIQGGRLALASRAPVTALIVSDVTGDDPSAIASGPCAPDPSTYADALAVLVRWRVEAPPAVAAWLRAGAEGRVEDTPKPGDGRLAHATNTIVATPRASLLAAAHVFRAAGVTPVLLGDTVTGEARDVGSAFASIAREVALHESPAWRRPVALISGGECTVTLRGAAAAQLARGGRCSEFLLSLACALQGLPGVHAIAADTDGIDGSESNAGALLAPDSLARARALGLQARDRLDANDAWSFFAALDDLVVTGPTLTNVNDYRAILVA